MTISMERPTGGREQTGQQMISVREDSPLRGKVLFIVGARRSGTNWLFRMVNSHPQVIGIPPETHLFAEGLRPLSERFHHGAISSPRTGSLYMRRDSMLGSFRVLVDAALAEFADAYAPGQDFQYLMERSPSNARHMDLLRDVYPDATVIHIIRDPRDVASSLVRQSWGPSDFVTAVEEWRDSVVTARAHAPERYLEVRYEELMHDPVNGVLRLLRWLRLDAPESVQQNLAEAAHASFNVDPSNPVVRIGKWNDAVTDQQRRVLALHAGDLMQELGYWESGPTGHRRLSVFRRTTAALRELPGKGRRALHLPRHRWWARPHAEGYEYLLEIANRAIAALEAGDGPSLHLLLQPDARIRWGVGAVRRPTLAEVGVNDLLARHPKLSDRWRQTRGDVHVHPEGFTAVLTYSRQGDDLAWVTLIARTAPALTRGISSVVYYRS
jgi:hypothetical protein